MMKKLMTLCLLSAMLSVPVFAQVKILFDCTKAETAGNADWVIDADAHNIDWGSNDVIGTGTASNPQRYPTPLQNTITTTSAETTWEGGLSAWGIDCVNYGFEVETLTPHDSITYGNPNHAQDLMNYKVYVMDEPNIRFTQSEKNAILAFVRNGGGLFMISDHQNSDRNNDGWDSPNIWNDFLNTVTPVNPFGIKFDLDDISPASTNVSANANDSIIHGPYGAVTDLSFSGATLIHIYPDSNSTATGDIWMNGVRQTSHDSIMFAHAHFGAGKVAAISDSSPSDDGTGNPAATLYAQYLTGDNGSDRKMYMNAIIWLAESSAPVTTDSFRLVTPANVTVCAGTPVTITATGATTYSWTPGGQTTASITVTPAASGLYIVTGTTGAISKKDTVTVTADLFAQTTPQLTAGGPLDICAGSSITLSAPAVTGYVWSSGQTTSSISASQAGTYTATLTDANGCRATTNSLTVNMDAFSSTHPQITTGGPVAFCTGGSVTLTAPAGYTYAWNNSATQQTITVHQTGTFYATVTDGSNCHALTDTIVVNVNAAITGVQITPAGTQTICTGNTLGLTAPTGYTSYLWSTGSTNQAITVAQAGNYYVVVSSGANCNGQSNTVSVSMDNFSTTTPQITANGPLTFCQGGSVMLTATGGASYNWSNNTHQATNVVNQSGNYNVTVTDAGNCSATSNALTVTVNPLPVITFSISPDSVCNTVGSVLLHASPTGGMFTGTGVSGTQISPASAGIGTYQITYSYTDSNGCNNSQSSNLTVYICTGIEEVISAGIRVYPNPSAGIFLIQSTRDFTPQTIRVFDAMGRLVVDMPVNTFVNDLIRLDMRNFASGIYIAELEQNNIIIRKKLLKAE